MSDARSAIAKFCAAALARGTPTRDVLEAEARLRRLADGGLSALVEFPELGLACRLPPPGGARRKLFRPAAAR